MSLAATPDEDRAKAGSDAPPVTAKGTEEAPDESWKERHGSIEEAWLEGEIVGSEHERRHFLYIVKRVANVDTRYQDRGTLLETLGALRAQMGEVFCYCLLDAALRGLHRPTLLPR